MRLDEASMVGEGIEGAQFFCLIDQSGSLLRRHALGTAFRCPLAEGGRAAVRRSVLPSFQL